MNPALRYLAAAYAWVEGNKVALGAVGAAAGAVVRLVTTGADAGTLVLAVVALFAALTHLTVTPVSNPKTASGVPLVPATAGIPTLAPATTTVLADLPQIAGYALADVSPAPTPTPAKAAKRTSRARA